MSLSLRDFALFLSPGAPVSRDFNVPVAFSGFPVVSRDFNVPVAFSGGVSRDFDTPVAWAFNAIIRDVFTSISIEAAPVTLRDVFTSISIDADDSILLVQWNVFNGLNTPLPIDWNVINGELNANIVVSWNVRSQAISLPIVWNIIPNLIPSFSADIQQPTAEVEETP